jgi:hypothetical protein
MSVVIIGKKKAFSFDFSIDEPSSTPTQRWRVRFRHNHYKHSRASISSLEIPPPCLVVRNREALLPRHHGQDPLLKSLMWLRLMDFTLMVTPLTFYRASKLQPLLGCRLLLFVAGCSCRDLAQFHI